MNVFLSYGFDDAEIATCVSRALEHRHVQVFVNDNMKPSPGEQWAKKVEQMLTRADAIVFLVGAGAVRGDSRLESEWRSALRAQWDSDGSKPMIPLLIGNASLPPFLRDRQALRLDQPNVNYDHLAERIVEAVERPEEPMNAEHLAAARAEQSERLGELKRFAETLRSVSLGGDESNPR